MEAALLYVAFATGLVGSLHCVGMCGPIAMALPVGGLSTWQALLARLIYTLGRLGAYMSLGYAFGYFGLGLQWAGFQQWLSIVIGLAMFALLFFNHAVSLAWLQRGIGQVKMWMGKFIHHKSWLGFGVLGFFNGLLPCGILYLALAGATATFTPWHGAWYMLAFGLGTAPALWLVGMLPKLIKHSFRLKFQKVVPVYSFLLALFFIVRGLNLGIPYVSPKFDTTTTQQAIPVCHGVTQK